MSTINKNIEPGNIVNIKDGSYMLTVNTDTDELTHYGKKPNEEIGLNKNYFVVIAVNVPCPSYDNCSSENVLIPQNNCIIKDIVTYEIWFCSRINIIKNFYINWCRVSLMLTVLTI